MRMLFSKIMQPRTKNSQSLASFWRITVPY